MMSMEAELMAICTGLIPAIERDNIYDIIIITDSIAAARKILESKVNPLQNIFIPIAAAVNAFLRKDSRNKIHFWYCPSKAKWPRHQLVNDQVKAGKCTLCHKLHSAISPSILRRFLCSQGL